MKTEMMDMKKDILRLGPLFGVMWALLLSLASCKDDFDISKLQETPRLVVYCFPTESDTTLIAVSKSLPIAQVKGDKSETVCHPVDALVRYQVNGQECKVERISTEQAPHVLTKVDSALWMEGQYYVVTKQKSGDHISLEVSADGMASVTASTYIPQEAKATLDTVYSKSSYSYPDRLEATLLDNGSTTDYYALAYVSSYHPFGKAIGSNQEHPRPGWDEDYVFNAPDYMKKKDQYKYWDFSDIKPKKLTSNLDVSSEPLFDKYSKIDEDFGFDDYSYFGGLYIFDDKRINGRPYTFHVNIDDAYVDDSGNYFWGNPFMESWDTLLGCEYYLVFYTLTPEYYRFLAAINDSDNNDWADMGIMQVTPTYSNVKGGLGIVAGYYVNKVKKKFVPTVNEEMYTNNR